MRWFRLTTRRMMMVILCLAILLGLGLPAVAVLRDPSAHVHSWVGEWYGAKGVQIRELNQPTFWDRYRHRLTGLSWEAPTDCGMSQGLPGESCSYREPMRWSGGALGPNRMRSTPAILAVLQADARSADPPSEHPTPDPVSPLIP